MTKGRRPPAKLGLAAVLIGALVLAFAFLPIDRWVLELVAYIQGAGASGAFAYAVIYIIATLLFLPGSLLTLGAGFAYGPLWGTLLVSPASVIAATLAFVLGRSFAREWVVHRVRRRPRFDAIDRAVGENGFRIVFLLRLSPVFPFNLLNYALGLTRVSLRAYVLASALGMLPGTFLYVYLGSLITTASELASGVRPEAGALEQSLYWVGLGATLIVILTITRLARRALRKALEQQNGSPDLSRRKDHEV